MSDLEDNDDEKSDDSGSEPLRWYVFFPHRRNEGEV
jgi:hypothetical protein